MNYVKSKGKVGQVNTNKFGTAMEVIEYNNCNDVLIKFEDGGLVNTKWERFIKGEVKSPYDRSVYDVGFLGEGKYKPVENGIRTRRYATWGSMLERCYSDKFQKKRPRYIGSTVCDEWHNFQNFAKWYDENYYEIEGETMNLDKDILIPNNKIYSPESAIFAPTRINSLFIKSYKLRDGLPVGVHKWKGINKYLAGCGNGNRKSIKLGYYDTPEQAFLAYKNFKEKVIKQFAEEYKDKIPSRLYNALKRYEVSVIG